MDIQLRSDAVCFRGCSYRARVTPNFTVDPGANFGLAVHHTPRDRVTRRTDSFVAPISECRFRASNHLRRLSEREQAIHQIHSVRRVA